MRDDVIVEDTTLRDGEQAAGVALAPAAKMRILDALLDGGLRWVEVGIPAMGGEELEFLRAAQSRTERANLVLWNRGVRGDVEFSLGLGYRHIHIGLPTSKVHLADSVGKSRQWLFDTARELVDLVKSKGAFASISAEDLARTEPELLVEYAQAVTDAGADRLRLSDTIGVLTPEEYARRVKLVVDNCAIDVQCHAHNDFGLAFANTLAGLQAGARYFHVTVNGVGERAGMTDLAQAAVTLQRLYGLDLGVDATKLTAISRLVAQECGQGLFPWQPIVGSNVFAHESGIHVKGMLKNASTFEPFPPEEVGNERHYVLGKHSGRALIELVLRTAGRDFTDDDLADSLAWVRRTAIERGGPVTEEELLARFDARTPIG
jgi:homocitrate synthase NifV